MTLASRTTRLVGQCLDWIVAILPFVVLMIFTRGLESVSDSAASLYVVLAFGFGAGYYLFADAMPGGQSLGKQLLGIAVVHEHTGAPCTVAQSFVRNVLQPILGILDWIFIVGSRRQRLGDMVAGTIVIDRHPYRDLDRFDLE